MRNEVNEDVVNLMLEVKDSNAVIQVLSVKFDNFTKAYEKNRKDDEVNKKDHEDRIRELEGGEKKIGWISGIVAAIISGVGLAIAYIKGV